MRGRVIEFLEDYGLILLFGVMALQALGVAGLPGKTALVTAAILAAEGAFAIEAVIAVGIAAVTLGGFAGYAVGRWGGRRLLERPGIERRFGSMRAATEAFFTRHGAKAVFLARFLPGFKVVVAFTAGALLMPLRTFAVWHVAAAIAFSVGFGLGAYFVGEGAIELAEAIGLYAFVPLAAAAALLWALYRAQRRRRARAAAVIEA